MPARKNWYIWAVYDPGHPGFWHGPKNFTNDETWRYEYGIEQRLKKPYRYIWNGQAWVYDPRPRTELMV